MKKFIALLFFLIAIAGCYDYSQGSRVGTVIKFSKKGLMNKTWEGTMLMGGVARNRDGILDANIWNFSVDQSGSHGEDPEGLIREIQQALESGKRVRIFYTEELFVSPWRADSKYFVRKVEIIE